MEEGPFTAAAGGHSSSMDQQGPEKPGLVKKLARALKLHGQQLAQGSAGAAAEQNQQEEDEDLLVMGRMDGQLDLGATLQWQAGLGEEMLQGFGAQMQDG